MGIQNDTKALRRIEARLAEIAAWDDQRLYALVESVSGWSPAQQLDHIVRSGTRMLDMVDLLVSGAPHENVRATGRPSLMARVVLLTGRIPRGKAQAPEVTRPPRIPSRAALVESVDDLRRRIAARADAVDALRGASGVGRHPVLGWFRAPHWWRFLRIHSEHHLAIVDDIDRVRTRAVPLEAPAEPVRGTSLP